MRFWLSMNGMSLLVSILLTATLAFGFALSAIRFLFGEWDILWRLLAFGCSLPLGVALCAIFASRRESGGE